MFLSFFSPTNVRQMQTEFRMGHQYFVGDSSGAIKVILTPLCLKYLIKGPIRANGGKHKSSHRPKIVERTH